MREVTPELASVLKGSRDVSCYVSAYYDGEPVGPEQIPVTGSLEVATENEVTGSIKLTVPRIVQAGTRDHDMLPVAPDSPLSCEGVQLALTYTIGLPGAGREAVGLGWWRIQEWSEGDGIIDVTANSLDTILQEARLVNPYQTKKGTSYQAAFKALAGSGTLLPISINVPNDTLGKETYEEDRLAALKAITDAWPARMWIDDSGTLVVDPALDDATDPVVGQLTDGTDGTLVEAPVSGSRDEIYNAVKASGESTGDVAPVSAVEYLRDGPRRWNGPYGNVPYFYASPLITKKTAAQKAAKTRLRNLQVRANPVTITAAPDPRWELGDVLELVQADKARLVRIDQIALPLGTEAMTITGHEITR